MKRKVKIIIILSILILSSAVGFIFVYKQYQDSNNQIIIDENTNIENEEIVPSIYETNYTINNDYIGEIVFESNMINDSFVQAKKAVDEYTYYDQGGHIVNNKTQATGNDVYMWMNWKTGEWDFNDHGGSIFMDYRNSINDQNIIIYGHHFSEAAGYDPERIKAFTPLEKLLKKENYQTNKYVNLLLQDETRRYELVGVYLFDVNDDYYWDNLQYFRPFYDFDDFNNEINEKYYENYITALNEVKLYETDASLTIADKTLTLQTCISGHQGELYEICVFKQIKL